MSDKLAEEGRIYIGSVMSNFDHEIDSEIAERLKTEHAYALYTAWNFCGNVWWGRETYCCEVWRFRKPVEEVSGTLEEIMDELSDRWGKG